MNVELVAQMFKNYQSNVLFHLEGMYFFQLVDPAATCSDGVNSNGESAGAILVNL